MTCKTKLAPEEFKALLPLILAAADAPLAVLEFEPDELTLDFEEVPEVSLTPSRAPTEPTAPLPPVSGTRAILIRVPERVIRAFKIEAERTGGHYQTLMNRALNAAAGTFVFV